MRYRQRIPVWGKNQKLERLSDYHPPKETCGLYIDLFPSEPAPKPGDFIVSQKKAPAGDRRHWFPAHVGSVYQVITVRKVKRKDETARPRYVMRCFRSNVEEMEASEKAKPKPHWFRFRWYPRGKTTVRRHTPKFPL